MKMKLLAPPLYVLTTNTLEKNKGIEVLNAACQIAKTTVEARKGRLLVKEAARAVSERDERLLNETVLNNCRHPHTVCKAAHYNLQASFCPNLHYEVE